MMSLDEFYEDLDMVIGMESPNFPLLNLTRDLIILHIFSKG